MKVPLLNLQGQYASLRDEMRESIERVFASQHFVLGAQGRALESAVAEYSQTKFAVGCASGSDALLLALMALDIERDDVPGALQRCDAALGHEDLRQLEQLAVVEAGHGSAVVRSSRKRS